MDGASAGVDLELQRAAKVLPAGASSFRRSTFGEVIVAAEGAHLKSLSGRSYLDHHLAFGAINVGHCNPQINAAVASVLGVCDVTGVGPQLGEIELAEKICEVLPSAERVAFTTSGTAATLQAVQLARAANGRSRLLKFRGSYHGWHDHLAVGSHTPVVIEGTLATPDAGGLLGADVAVLEWNDLPAVEALFEAEGESLAAVICEPHVSSYGCIDTVPGYLEQLRKLCDRYGVVLIFDEVKTGFRVHLGGYQALSGVTPDVTVFAKAVANGFTLAGIAGKADAMEVYGRPVGERPTIGGTYNGSPYAVAAGAATLEIMAEGGVDRLGTLGDLLRRGLAAVLADLDVEGTPIGLGSMWSLYLGPGIPRNYAEALAGQDEALYLAFEKGMRQRGILLSPGARGLADQRLCVAMHETDIDATVEAAHESLRDAVATSRS
jgi:glutamate-1-semialdehyde 2,1-aminomutase